MTDAITREELTYSDGAIFCEAGCLATLDDYRLPGEKMDEFGHRLVTAANAHHDLVEALREADRAIRDMLTGVAVHNDRKLEHHTPIKGPVVSALASASQKARAALASAEALSNA